MTRVQGPGQYFSSRVLSLQVPYQEGLDIKILQSLLRLLPEPMGGLPIETDGIFGPDTRKALMLFQKYFQIAPTGSSNDETYYYLGHRSSRYSRGKPVFSSRIIMPGSWGQDVQILQNRLSAYPKSYLNRPSNGKYDQHTARAVKLLQEDFNLEGEEGRVGPYTYALILLLAPLGGRVLKKGRHGLDSYFLQQQLKHLGYYHDTPNGFFSHTTFKALRSFQKDAAIRADGIAGPQTYLALGHAQSFPALGYSYIIQKGDSISSLARLVNQTEAKLMEVNKLKGRPRRLKPGQCLNLPVPLSFHLIQKSESINSIAEQYGLDPQKLAQANPIQERQGLVPGASLFLPGYCPQLKGQICYLNIRSRQVEIKVVNLEKMHSRVLYRLDREKPGFDRYGLESCGMAALELWSRIYRLWQDQRTNPRSSPDDQLFRGLQNSKKLHPLFRKEGFISEFISSCSRAGSTGRTKYAPAIEARNLSSSSLPLMISPVLKEYFDDQALLHYRLSPDQNHLLLFVIIPPARDTAAFLYHLPSAELHKISEHAVDGIFSSDSRFFLLLEKDSYGACYPWFYQQINLYSSSGYRKDPVMKVRSCQINEQCFKQDNSLLLFIMHTPRTFYPLPEYRRHIYIKSLQSPLLFQLTSNEKPFYPIWV